MKKINLGHLKKLDREATPGKWWNESGVIHTMVNDRCRHTARCDEDGDAELVAEYRNETPRLIEWIEKAIPFLREASEPFGWNENPHRKAIESLLEEVSSCKP